MKKVIRIGNGKTKTLNTETAEVVAIKYTQGMQGYKCTYNLKFYKTKDGIYFSTYNGVLYHDWSTDAAIYGTIQHLLEEIIGESTFIFFGHLPTSGYETTPFMVFFDDSDETVKYVENTKQRYVSKYED